MTRFAVVLERPEYQVLTVYVDAENKSDAIVNAMSLDVHNMDWKYSSDIGDALVVDVYTELEKA